VARGEAARGEAARGEAARGEAVRSVLVAGGCQWPVACGLPVAQTCENTYSKPRPAVGSGEALTALANAEWPGEPRGPGAGIFRGLLRRVCQQVASGICGSATIAAARIGRPSPHSGL
jgi:hypothetical protein